MISFIARLTRPALGLTVVSGLIFPLPGQAAGSRITATPEAIAKWQDRAFGMFIHWGPVTLTGREISWSRGKQTPLEEYDSLYTRFNPVDFDADAWAQLAQDAGMTYLILTTKHHDGFCLWDSPYTEHDMGSTPYGKGVVGPLAEACRKRGISFGIYYSICDWVQPYSPNIGAWGKQQNPNVDQAKFAEYITNQLIELLTNYGEIAAIWFDVPQDFEKVKALDVLRTAYALQPDLVVNDRAARGVAGDYRTSEQHVGEFDASRPWETCMTIGHQWSYRPDDASKELSLLVHNLVQTRGGNGNMLLNVGPDDKGVVIPSQAERLRELGRWVKTHREALIESRGGPWICGRWGAATQKDKKAWLFIDEGRPDGTLHLLQPARKVTGWRVVSGGSASCRVNTDTILVSHIEQRAGGLPLVLELDLEAGGGMMPPIPMHTYGTPVLPDSVTSNDEAKHPHLYILKDRNPHSYYHAVKLEKDDWIELYYNQPHTFTHIDLHKQEDNWNCKPGILAVEVPDPASEGTWREVARTPNSRAAVVLELPVETDAVRLKAVEGESTLLQDILLFNRKEESL